jgi:amino acid adenylation domain-containing protein
MTDNSAKQSSVKQERLAGEWTAWQADLLPAVEPEVFPLSYAQEGLWFLDQFNGGGPAYNINAVSRLRGPLDTQRLEHSLRALITRHPALRTRMKSTACGPMQEVMPADAIANAFSLLRLPLPPDRADDTTLRRTLQPLLLQAFDLRQAPLMRASLFEVSDEHHVLVLTVHHIVADGWSMSLLHRELGQIYAHATLAQQGDAGALQAHAMSVGELPPPSRLFTDHAQRQRQRWEGDTLAADLAYWREQLHDLPTLELPLDHARPAQVGFVGQTLHFDIAPEHAAGMRSLARQQFATPFMAFLAVFQVLLMRISGQCDIPVGVPMAGRRETGQRAAARRGAELPEPGFDNVVGYFVNTVVLRGKLDDAPGFIDVLRRTRSNVLGALAHADMPFDRLVAALSPQRDAGRNPLFQVAFLMDGFAHRTVDLPGVQAERLPIRGASAMMDLSLNLVEESGNLKAELEFRTDLFEPATIERMVRHFHTLLSSILADPQLPIDHLSLLDEAECQDLQTWNTSATVYPREQQIQSLLRAQALRTPQGVALRQGTAEMCYEQLDASSDAWAQHLRQAGVCTGAIVGVCMERCFGQIVALLAILKAGCAYLPLGPEYPAERLHVMLNDAAPAAVLTQQHLRPLLQPICEAAQLIDLPADGGEPPQDAYRPLVPPTSESARPTDAAYVIYTSGSTGKPKGVVVPHRAVVNFLHAMQSRPGLVAQDRLLAITTLSFDIAVLELLLPLSVGASIVLTSREQATDGAALRALLDGSGANVMQATPSTWHMLLDAGWMGDAHFKALVGGESLSPNLARALLERTGELWNMYGPTETTVWSSCWRVHAPLDTILIGRPIANTRIHVLDALGQHCPVGVSGEIHIGGDGVAIGYLHQPELTAERFIPDPFSSTPGERLYKTGDRGRWRQDGLLEHQGRLDFQIKLRGHRIEPSEIEARLQAHPTVRQSLVMVREDEPADPRLVAYVLADAVANGAPDVQALREHLRAALPAYMLPQHIVVLEALPLLPNGKINRHALPQPSEGDVARRSVGRDHMNAAALALAQIWSSLIGCDDIQLTDNFFDLGGHSLLANRAVLAFEQVSGCRLELRRLISETLGQLTHGLVMPQLSMGKDAAKPNGMRPPVWWSRLARRLRSAYPVRRS